MSQPAQIFVNDYFGGKSIVVRTEPTEFLKPYAGNLTAVSGKWNYGLKDPTGTAKLGGWIFPKKNETQVREVLSGIIQGTVQPSSAAPTAYAAPYGGYQQQAQLPPNGGVNLPQSYMSQLQSQTLAGMGQQYRPQLTLLASAPSTAGLAVGRPESGAAYGTPLGSLLVGGTSPRSLLSPVAALPGAAPVGYQQVVYIVPKPVEGGTLYLSVDNQKVPVIVQSVTATNGITDKAVIRLPDNQTTNIVLQNDKFTIPGFTQAHTISVE
jgi:hypothetical protein